MDGQRQFPAEPEPWFGDHPESGDPERVPGQRGADRYADGSDYEEQPDYLEPPNFGLTEPARRRRPGRPVRVGRRSGLELPDADPSASGEYDDAGDGPLYRAAERLDRQALRRDGQTYGTPAPSPGFEQPGYDQDQQHYDRPEYDRTEFDRGEFDQTGYDSRPPGGLSADRPGADRADAYPIVPPPYGAPAQMPSAILAPHAAPTQALPTGAPAAVYLARRPGVAVLLGIAGVVVELLLVRVLLDGEFAHNVSAGGVLGGLFAMAGVPMVGIGLYGLACGAATANGPAVARTWLRPPLAYLPIGLILLIAAGLAA